jgi:hypothetical protein
MSVYCDVYTLQTSSLHSFILSSQPLSIHLYVGNERMYRKTFTRPDEYGVEETVTDLVPGMYLYTVHIHLTHKWSCPKSVPLTHLSSFVFIHTMHLHHLYSYTTLFFQHPLRHTRRNRRTHPKRLHDIYVHTKEREFNLCTSVLWD